MIDEKGKLSLPKLKQDQKDLRQGELLNHNKKVKALERKNKDQETRHGRMIKMLERLVDCQDNQLKHQKFETGEQEKKLQQEITDLKEVGVKQEMEHRDEMKEMMEIGVKQEMEHRDEMKEMKEMMETGVKQLREQEMEHSQLMQAQEDLRQEELMNHNKKVDMLEKKNLNQELLHAKMKFEMGEQEKKFQQEITDMKEVGIKRDMEHRHDMRKMKEVMEIGAVQLREQEMTHRQR